MVRVFALVNLFDAIALSCYRCKNDSKSTLRWVIKFGPLLRMQKDIKVVIKRDHDVCSCGFNLENHGRRIAP